MAWVQHGYLMVWSSVHTIDDLTAEFFFFFSLSSKILTMMVVL